MNLSLNGFLFLETANAMDAIKKKMEKLSNETSEAEVRINHVKENISFFYVSLSLFQIFFF